MRRDLTPAEKQAAAGRRSRFGAAAGPEAPLGEYTVALLVDGKTWTVPAAILPDPAAGE
jgi:hypothetical protein